MIDIEIANADPIALDVNEQSDVEIDVGDTIDIGSNNYEKLQNKPQIGGVELVGDVSLEDIGAAASEDIPTKISDLDNDEGYLTAETDPTVPSWAKQQNKPSYTAQEVGALPDDTQIPSKTSDLTNDSGFIDTAIFFGTTATAAATGEKAVTCADFTSNDLKAGAAILVQFSNTNSAAVADLRLNVNDTGAKAIKYINNGTLGNLAAAGHLKASTTYLFIYDGTYWVVYLNYNSTYSALAQADMQTGTATTGRLITAAMLKEAIGYHPPAAHTHTKSEITDFPTIPTVPTNISAFTNDAGYLTLADLPVYNGGVS